MRALTFLWTRQFVNGIRRSLTSGRRLIGVLFFGAYYVWMLRPMWSADAGRTGAEQMRGALKGMSLPSVDVLEVLVFYGFGGMSLLLLLGLLSYRGGFRPADVDVLFPTPISPKLVMMFRLARDTLLTLILPLLFALLFGRQMAGPVEELFRSLPNPAAGPHVGRLATGAWLLTSLAWVALGYAVSLWIHRADLPNERRRRTAVGILTVVFAAFTVAIGLQIRTAEGLGDWIEFGREPLLRGALFLATAAAWLTTGPLAGDWAAAAVGFATLVGAIALGLGLALRQSPYLYEQGALHAAHAQAARERQASGGNVLKAAAEVAQQGKVKTGLPRWIAGWRPTGARALVWKEAVLLWRAYRSLVLFVVPLAVLIMLPALLASDRRGNLWLLVLILQFAITMVGTSMLANSGYQELLQRVDLQKPLPFTPARTLSAEIWGKALLGILGSWTGVVALLVVRPAQAPMALACAALMPTLAALLSAVFAVFMLLLPDYDDPTQRGFRSLMQLLALVLFVGPSAALFIGLVVWGDWTPVAAAGPAAALNLAAAWLAATLAGALYTSFQPND